MENRPNKNLGQHWLFDSEILRQIVDAADVSANDTVLEIGPGLGTLTEVLSENAGRVIAVEFDQDLAAQLRQKRFKNVEIINQDFLKFDLDNLPQGYKVVANIPYYITAKIIQKLVMAKNRPVRAALLVQKEVAERLAASPGQMSILSVATQLFSEVDLGIIVPPEMFTPPPKVDSQVVILMPHAQSIFSDLDEKKFFRLVRAGFGERRKKLRSSLAGGLSISKPTVENLLKNAGIDPNLRAQDLSLEDWHNLEKSYAE